MSEDEPGSLLIAGLGNVLLTDDGVGVHAVRELQRRPPAGAMVVEIGTAVLHGLSFVETARRVLLIDAMQGGRPPGTIYLSEMGRRSADAEGPAQPFTGQAAPAHSLHSLSLLEAMRVLLPDRPLPPVTVIGVEPAALNYGLSLTPAVAAVLPRIVALARRIVLGWRAGTAPAAAAGQTGRLLSSKRP